MRNAVNSESLERPWRSRDVLYQVSLLQGLTNGDYYGSITVGELKQHGDTGIGTFNRLNGELVLLDGEVYRVNGNGSVEVVSDEETIPFSVVSFLDVDASINLHEISDFHALHNDLNQIVMKRGMNRFHMIRIDGMFRKITVRSVYAQEEPYKKLTEVLECDQTFFTYDNIEGTMVGLYCPPYMSALNAVGWHLHFISGDKTKGGHVLGVNISDAVLTWDDINGFELRLPNNKLFTGFDLTIDQSEDIKKVETYHGK